MKKECPRCKKLLDIKNFLTKVSKTQKFNVHCPCCIKLINSEYYQKNRKKILKKRQIHFRENFDIMSAKQKKHYKANSDRICKRQIEYSKRPEVKKRTNKRVKLKRKNDIQFYLRSNIASRILVALKNHSKSENTLKLLGCDIPFFKKYLKNKFKHGMNWKNRGKNRGRNGWVLDHILPCELFDLSDERQQKICFNYKNMQPLWNSENSKKNDFLPNGVSAKTLTKEEKLDYLKSLGYNL